jgi:hypothetical protein
LLHELTHIVLEEPLTPEWEAVDLGWKMTEGDTVIELPGGARTIFYNERPQECVTSYACLQQDDDRADSVVAYFFAPERLHLKRREILDKFFDKTDEVIVEAIVDTLTMELPKLPKEIGLKVSEKKRNLFKIIARKKAPERRVVSLEDFRKERGIAEPEF